LPQQQTQQRQFSYAYQAAPALAVVGVLRIAISCSCFTCFHAAATAPSCHPPFPLTAAHPRKTRPSGLPSVASRSEVLPPPPPPPANAPRLYGVFSQNVQYAVSKSVRSCGCTLLAFVRTCSMRPLI